MPAIETSCLKQTAVLWPFAGYDANGEPTVGAAVEIKVRWEEGLRDAISPTGEPIGTNAIIDVDREIANGSRLWLGTIATLPAVLTGAVSVIDYNSIPDIKAIHHQRYVTVINLGDITL